MSQPVCRKEMLRRCVVVIVKAVPCLCRQVLQESRHESRKLCVNDLGVLMPVVDVHPHLRYHVSKDASCVRNRATLTLRKVLRPARILPPIHVLYLRSGGAKILMRMSFTASRWTSCNKRSPKPLVRVEPPDRTMFA